MPAEVQYTALDLSSLPPLNLVLESIAGGPGSPANGRVWFNSTTGKGMIHNASGDLRVGIEEIANADVATGAAIAESKLALASDAVAATPSRRTLGFGAQQAMPGNARLDQITSPTAAVGFNGQRITNVADPTGNTDAATMQWVNNRISASESGQEWKEGVRLRADSNVVLATPGATLDGVTMTTGDRVLLVGQTLGAQNGIYVWNGAAAAMIRADDANDAGELSNGTTVPVGGGTAAGTVWMLTTGDPITIGTTALTFTQVGGSGASYLAGTGLDLTGNTFSLETPVAITNGGTGAASASAARTSLGVAQKGTAVDLNAITAGGNWAYSHGFGSADLVVQVRNKTSGAKVNIDFVLTSSQVTFYSDVAVASAELRAVIVPIV